MKCLVLQYEKKFKPLIHSWWNLLNFKLEILKVQFILDSGIGKSTSAYKINA